MTMPAARRLLLLMAAACVSLAGLSGARAMEFSLAAFDLPACQPRCPLVIVASGEIELNSDEAFFRFVASEVMQRQVASTILLSSPGGNLLGSLKLGLMMRHLGFSLMVGQVRERRFVTARCYSACAYTLAGGKRRIVPDGSEVGVHRAWIKANGQRDFVGGGTIDPDFSPQRHQPMLSRYLRQMGVSDQIVALADSTPSSSIRVLTAAELSRFRLSTGAGGEKRRRGR